MISARYVPIAAETVDLFGIVADVPDDLVPSYEVRIRNLDTTNVIYVGGADNIASSAWPVKPGETFNLQAPGPGAARLLAITDGPTVQCNLLIVTRG